MEKVTKVRIPLYHGILRIVISDDFTKSSKKLNIDNEGHDLSMFGAFVTTSIDDNRETNFNVFFAPDVEHDSIAHEVVHLVNAIYISRRITLDPNNDEPQAYLTGWITGAIYRTIKK